MLHRLLEWDFYASVLKENPPAPENKSINFKKYIFAKEVHDTVDFQQQDQINKTKQRPFVK